MSCASGAESAWSLARRSLQACHSDRTASACTTLRVRSSLAPVANDVQDQLASRTRSDCPNASESISPCAELHACSPSLRVGRRCSRIVGAARTSLVHPQSKSRLREPGRDLDELAIGEDHGDVRHRRNARSITDCGIWTTPRAYSRERCSPRWPCPTRAVPGAAHVLNPRHGFLASALRWPTPTVGSVNAARPSHAVDFRPIKRSDRTLHRQVRRFRSRNLRVV